MTKRLTFGIILTVLLTMFGRPCYAPTDWVVNAMDYANGLVKDGSAVVEEYSSYANIDIQGKMGQMGDFNAAKKSAEKVKKVKDRADKAQKKYKKMKALADKAKEKKAALEKKVKAAKDKADKLKEKYEKAQEKINKAKEKIDKAKDKINEAKDKINEVKDKVNEAKDKVNEIKDKVNEAKDKVNEVKDKVNEVKGQVDAGKGDGNDVSENDAESEIDTKADAPASDNQPQFTPVSNTTKIDAAAAMQNLATVDGAVTTEINLPGVETSQLMETSISAAEVQELAEDSDADIAAEEVFSEFNLEEQLLMSDQLKAKERAEKAAPLLSNDELRGRLREGDIAKLESLRQSRRQSFGSKAATEEGADE